MSQGPATSSSGTVTETPQTRSEEQSHRKTDLWAKTVPARCGPPPSGPAAWPPLAPAAIRRRGRGPEDQPAPAPA